MLTVVSLRIKLQNKHQEVSPILAYYQHVGQG